jgi:hypothetical protein
MTEGVASQLTGVRKKVCGIWFGNLLRVHHTVCSKDSKNRAGSSQARHGELSAQRPICEWRERPEEATGNVDCQESSTANFFMQSGSNWNEDQKAHVYG